MWLVICLLIQSLHGFNVDLNSIQMYQKDSSSLFGFSVTGHIENNVPWIIVGAPEGEIMEQKKAGVTKGGAVYRCETVNPFQCYHIPFDTTGNNNASGHQIDDKSYQWFGASVHSSGRNGVIVACAPRYVYFSINNKRREPVGTCFTATDAFSKFSEYSPCRNDAWGYHQQGYCQAGFSAAVSEDRLFIGAVGSFYGQGQAFSQNLKNRLDLVASKEGPADQDNNYLGYSLATGDFTGKNNTDLAVGMPRGANLTGKVVIYTGQRLYQLHNLTGNQIGAYFGYSLATLDANGDGLDDLAIGAPLHSPHLSSLSGRYETGRVYIVYQNEDHKFRHWDVLDGDESEGRFGLALSAIGDIDQDSYDDLVIGAPYSNSGRGAVFIYRGSSTGLEKLPSQVIRGQDLSESNLPRAFGFSLSGSSVDLDGNRYPDLIIGAPDSDQVFIFRSRPVVRVHSEIRLGGSASGTISSGGKIDSEHRNCSLSSGIFVACVHIRGCLEYSGDGVDEHLNFLVTFILDSKKQTNIRMFFLEDEISRTQEYIMKLNKKKRKCTKTYVYLVPELMDKLSPIEVRMTYELLPQEEKKSIISDLKPIVDPRDAFFRTTDSLTILKECGTDNICIPDLRIDSNSSLNNYLIGSDERLELNINITNNGEDAYGAVFYLQLSSSVYYKRIVMLDPHGPSILCSPPNLNNGFILKCDLGNPMMAFSQVPFLVIMKPTFNEGEASLIRLSMTVNSTNPELESTLDGNHLDFEIPVIVETALKIRGRSEPEPLQFNRSMILQEESGIGPEVTHVYQIENKGPSDILQAEVYILWPSFRAHEEQPLLYLTSQPIVEGPGRCDFSNDVNPYGIKIPTEESNVRNTRSYDDELLNELDCGPTKCSILYCVIGPLQKRQFTLFRIKSRLWISSLMEMTQLSGRSEFEISSRLVTRVTSLPYGLDPSYLKYETLRVTTHVQSLSGVSKGSGIPPWILLCSICAGLLFLGLLSLFLYKLGFFRRKRRPYQNGDFPSIKVYEESEPLSSKSSHSFQPGDEEL